MQLEYQIVAGIALGQLTEQVNEALADGWQLQGGVAIGMADTSGQGSQFSEIRPVVLQAMVRKKESDREMFFGEGE